MRDRHLIIYASNVFADHAFHAVLIEESDEGASLILNVVDNPDVREIRKDLGQEFLAVMNESGVWG